MLAVIAKVTIVIIKNWNINNDNKDNCNISNSD